MKLIFVHGWSVTSTETFGELPEVLQRETPKSLDLEIENIYLGEYISFHDEVTLFDIARAFESARLEKLGNEEFACITHSTGAPVLRLWIDLFYKDSLSAIPLTHLVMLAPANHGSALAVLGKNKLSRMKAWVQGVEPGVGVLNWLQLGSSSAWDLNCSWMEYEFENSFYPFVLSGEKIDEHFYDFINHYLVEKGTDGVVRLSSANLNYKKVDLLQDCKNSTFEAVFDGETIDAYPLILQDSIKISKPCAFEVIPNASHSGDKYGIMKSVKKRRVVKPVVNSILESLQVSNKAQYDSLSETMKQRSQKCQSKCHKHLMFVFSIKDNYGNKIHDYEMFLLAGKEYAPSKLPKGFFVDRQKNDNSGNLVYYLDYDKLKNIKDKKIGIRIVAYPNEGFCHYAPAEFRSEELDIEDFLEGNQTIMIEVTLQRRISKNTLVLNTLEDSEENFTSREVGEEFI